MNKRQMKKERKKEVFEAFQIITGTCLTSADPLATLKEFKNKREQHCKDFGLNVPPEVFDQIVTVCEQIIQELANQQADPAPVTLKGH